MNTNYLDKLQYNEILKKLSEFCITFIGKEMATSLKPSNNVGTIEESLKQTDEATSILYKASTPPISAITNIEPSLKILESEGILNIKAILDLNKILKISEDLKNYFAQKFIIQDDYPILNALFSNLYTNKSIYDKINKIIIDENTISDDASSKLKDIRRNQRNLEQSIKNTLTNFMHSHTKYLQENIITIRNGRYVIPVKEEYRAQIKGLVHDISSTGSTIFIEPISTFEINNDINNLKIQEKNEIENILKNLSNLLTPYIESFRTTSNIIGTLDFIFAKAKYSRALKASCPIINNEKIINLKNTKHPLLDQEKAVPINFSIGKNYSCLIITGPNTGGKTVTLKTIGLICLMAYSGLHIPADEGSSIYVFDNIFADIGDDQSIENSLSTFSSHILNIIEITKNATTNSLILLDELGSGTDPLEGANLAISILEHFKSINALTIATTHYQELKKYALVNNSFENASVEFNIETLSPTYKLLIGIPGKSNAFEISQKLGLDTEIIKKAKSYLNSNDIKFETVLQNIYDDKIQIENEKEQINRQLQEISKLREKLLIENNNKTKKEREIINNAKKEAKMLLQQAKEDINDILKEANSTTSTKELNNLRNALNEKMKNISITTDISNVSNKPSIKKEDIKPNLKVFVTTLNQEGVVLSNVSKSNQVLVQIGSMKMNIDINSLQISKNTVKNKSNYSYKISKALNINPEINVIGENVEDAIAIIDKYLDDSSLAKLPSIRIIHGKGTGKLKNGIHAFLKTNPHVKSFRMGTFGEGEMGVTVVELK